MSKTKELLKSIILGENYNEAFKSVMIEKISTLLEEKKQSMAKDLFIIQERELSDEEMKKREEYVKGMKKKKGEFEKRYGERAKEVMYATATKMAKGEMNDSVEEYLNSMDEAAFEKGKVDYFHGSKDPKASNRYSTSASLLKAKRQKPVAKPSKMINASYEETDEYIEEELKGDQHKLDHDKDGKIEASDLKKLRAKKKPKEESKE